MGCRDCILITEPLTPLDGDFWYDSATTDLQIVYDGVQWVDSEIDRTAPIVYSGGDMWYDETNNLLYTYDGSAWDLGETPYIVEPIDYQEK